ILRFASMQFEDRPLVFLNACGTSSLDPFRSNILEQSFFKRGCRAFIGTECKVPIVFASRFATVFFELFYRRVAPNPVSSGESFAQSRLFLLTQYSNIGGLFYTYCNSYDFFAVDWEELDSLCR